MKKTRKNQTKSGNLTRAVPVVLVLFLLLGIFVACGGLPASDNYENSTEKHFVWDDPPNYSGIEAPDLVIPEYEESVFEPEYTVCYVASSESNRYHRTSCHYVDQILSENLIYFYSENSARGAGYSPCSICEP